ncbi:hypothetical protein AXK12_07935 [Cephaloticoccus capnophilus]|uniref:DUF502 domain-containing protein n=1 Tax=Cephaloticoccus capnophilus TaxID=1548208 RepID=A0A139SI37_9BACT|nr:DUF502 domain-containing protein [Cephaloticoccus capnophilus]KXU34193.1 hypothetical protein AXK12_07935 [Cephaloticoccus capnophilus]
MSPTEPTDTAHPKLVTFRKAFFTGLALIAPLVITLWALLKIIALVGGAVRPFLVQFIPGDLPGIPLFWDVLATVIVLLLVALLGYVSRHVFARFLLHTSERLMLVIPGAGTIYNTVKQIVGTFGAQNRNLFSKVVLVQFPKNGSWMLGFVTSKEQAEPQAKTGLNEPWTIFVPTSPNPTTGFLLFLPPEDIVELEMNVADGMKLIISGGSVIPPWAPPTASSDSASRLGSVPV